MVTTVLLVVGVIIALIVLWSLGAYNRFVRLKALLEEAWSGIDVQLKRRYDLIPNLVSTVQGYSIHEKTVLETVTKMRSVSMNVTDVEAKAAAEAGLTQALKTLFAVAENYPNLKANENFLSLQKDLAAIESELQLARRYYNGTARNYNIAVGSFPSSVIAAMTGFSKAAYFEVNSQEEREAPKVKF